ncbi:MAG: tRNA uridine-5-carboxymethylaminomethyl(34) synthesis GTPase MnmE [Oscillospiraceae bacterium]|nr:tRNA uridine-5-carboxymethylaminomethyl(34) synthesis GTPase MnmE [Oscillospiraceae bacterium]
MNDTIAAIATPLTPSAIGILRLSGPGSVEAVDTVFTPFQGGPMSTRPDRALVYGALHDRESAVIDHCLCTVSRAPNSYTGEDTAELQCHGSPAALALGLEALFHAGARQAKPGEFTRRAFLNGKLDLTRTEAVADLIHAETPAAVRQAAGQLGGALADVVDGIYDDLTNLCAHFHAVLDYPDEDIEPFEIEELSAALGDAAGALDRLAATYRRGRLLNEGVPCAIVGRPNAGKSTLFNALLGYERAIVTDIPGTTRDTVEERVNFGGVLLRLIDTAGLRDADDEVERLGVERSRAAVERAELILVVVDSVEAENPTEAGGRELLDILHLVMEAGKPWIWIDSKCDLSGVLGSSVGMVGKGRGTNPAASVAISAVTGKGMDKLEEAVAALFPQDTDIQAGAMLTNARQAEAANRARSAVERGAEALKAGLSPDAVVADVEEAMSALGELTGRTVSEDVTARIFERFCVGK